MRFAIFATILASSFYAIAATADTLAPRDQTSDSTSTMTSQAVAQDCVGDQITMNLCASEKYKAAATELDSYYQKRIAKLKDTYAAAYLRKAQNNWAKFAALDCKYQASSWEGGSGWPYIYYSCMTVHASRRILNFQSYDECTENGCPN